MELHRLDGYELGDTNISGLDNLDIQDIDFETMEEGEFNGHQLEALEALGYVQDPEIAFEILDEEGNVVMYADAEENLYVLDGLGELGFFKKIGRGLKKVGRFVGKKVIRPVGRGIKKVAKFTGKKILKPALKTFNRFLNPATILLRNGFLLAMKINLMKVASRLRFGYLSDAEARKRGMNMSGFAKLKGAVRKAHKIYELAGGKSKNLKKAILTGKGNKNRSVPLRGFELGSPVDFDDDFTDEFERMVVEMGPDDVESLLEGTIEIEGLGAIATGSAIAAASGAVATVSSLLNKITGVFDKAEKVKSDVRNLKSQASSIASRGRSFVPTTNRRSSGGAAPPRVPTVRRLPVTPRRASISIPRSLPSRPSPARVSPVSRSIPKSIPSASSARTTALVPQTSQVQTTEEPQEKENFFQKNKKPLLIGAGVLIVGGGVYYAVKQSKKGKKSKSKSIDGVPRDKKGRFKSSGKSKSTQGKRKSKTSTKKEMVPTALL